MPSNGTPISKVHHRMPVFLDETTRSVWLDSNSSFKVCVDAITNSEVINGQSLSFV
jgi:putative SOS response-associated peptidase YedK